MRNTALLPSQAFHQSPSRSPALMDLLLPHVEQQERVIELLEWLISDACDVVVNIASQSEFVFAERRDQFHHATHG